jgi:hypothetical protein
MLYCRKLRASSNQVLLVLTNGLCTSRTNGNVGNDVNDLLHAWFVSSHSEGAKLVIMLLLLHNSLLVLLRLATPEHILRTQLRC